MFNLFYRKLSLAESGILSGMTDYHSHLLPGVDDGVQLKAEMLAILNGMEYRGIRKVWFTPHVMEDIPNATIILRRRFELMKKAYPGTIQLKLAAEYMLDNLFEERLETDDLLPLNTGGKRFLLVETSCFNPPMNLLSLLKRIQAKGYYPLLAHPERYLYMGRSDYRILKEERIAFQLNLPSLAGMYGKQVRKKAVHLLKAGMYDLVGNDIHSSEYFNTLLRAKIDSRSRDMLLAHFRACHDAL